MLKELEGVSWFNKPDIIEEAFKAGYHCQWIKDGYKSGYIFDPEMSPGDSDGAFKEWLKQFGYLENKNA